MTTLEGVDYSSGRPGGAALAAANKHFACRYLAYPGSPSQAKFLTAAERIDLHNHGIAVVANFESTNTRALDGYDAGVSDAHAALTDLESLGFPSNCPVYFSVDFPYSSDPAVRRNQQAKVQAYFKGVCSVLTLARSGIYGSYSTCVMLRQAKLASWFWQSSAWSGGDLATWIHIYQYLNSQSINKAPVDLDRAYQLQYGQWDPPPSGGVEEDSVSTVVLTPGALPGTVVVKTDAKHYWMDLASSQLRGPVGPSFGSPSAVAGKLTPPIPGGLPGADRTTGYQVTVDGRPSFLLATDVVFTPIAQAEPDCSAAIAADRAKAHIVYE